MNSTSLFSAAAALILLTTNSPQAFAQQGRLAPGRRFPEKSQAALWRRNSTAVRLQAPVGRLARLPASAGSNVIPATCPPEADGAVCGYVDVPLDRKYPRQAQIPIYFELYPHTGPGPAQSAIVPDPGGGGGDSATVNNRGFFRILFGPNLDVHDLLLIDGRGRGNSQAIDCEPLQHGTEPLRQAIADCAAQLGLAASRYGAGDIAEDIEAVRAALGYNKIDYYGGSYGGVEVTAYATRFPAHLRSIVLDSPFSEPQLKLFTLDHDRWRAIPQTVTAQCMHSLNCAPDHPNAVQEVNELVAAIRAHPVEGDTRDAGGNLVHVRVDEKALLNYVLQSYDFAFSNTGEVLAAAAALKCGDTAPLLRLASEGYFPLESDSGDPTGFSVGAEFAASVDLNPAPWDWSVPVTERKKQFEDAVADLPNDYFFPFSKRAATNIASSFVKADLWWEEPTAANPVVPRHSTLPNVPTLVLSGELDLLNPVSDKRVAALFPDSVLVTIPEGGHKPTTYLLSGAFCAANIASGFIENLHPGDTSCAQQPYYIWPAVGRFPVAFREARPAEVDSDGNNRAGIAERQIATVAIAAMTDALNRAVFVTGDGTGLRGGTFHADYGDVLTITLTDSAFARDVLVSGTVTLSFNDFSVSADLSVKAPGTLGGNLHIEGSWLFVPPPLGKFKVSGSLGGRHVAVLVPEA